MNNNTDYLNSLLDSPSESLNVEIKRWIDPDSPDGKAKIIKSCLAMRNNNGGYLIIGFDNKTGKPDLDHMPTDIYIKFHSDHIQDMVSRFSSVPFEVTVHLREKDGDEYPIIEVGSGIQVPVVTKSELKTEEKYLIKQNTVYVRTLNSNYTVSTSEATYKDYERLMQICFDNREADIGRFIRRHLEGINIEYLFNYFQNNSKAVLLESLNNAKNLLMEGSERFKSKVVDAHLNLDIDLYGWWEVAFIIDGEGPSFTANQDFLNLISSSNPRLTGWPVWLDSRGFSNEMEHPHVINGVWEAIIIGRGVSPGIDFWRIDPDGKFYLRRSLEDDTESDGEPKTQLDFELPIWRVTEALVAGMAFSKAMGCTLPGH